MFAVTKRPLLQHLLYAWSVDVRGIPELCAATATRHGVWGEISKCVCPVVNLMSVSLATTLADSSRV